MCVCVCRYVCVCVCRCVCRCVYCSVALTVSKFFDRGGVGWNQHVSYLVGNHAHIPHLTPQSSQQSTVSSQPHSETTVNVTLAQSQRSSGRCCCRLTIVVVTGSSSVSKVGAVDECERDGEEAEAAGAAAMVDEAGDWPILPSRPPDEAVDMAVTVGRTAIPIRRQQSQLEGDCYQTRNDALWAEPMTEAAMARLLRADTSEEGHSSRVR